ncbi:MAG: nitroreductase [Firmicutes bacterium]|nr:nitroreductase [Bacillota bacterium]
MNEVLKAIKERRSIRSYKPDMPSKEDLDKIIEAGRYAASAMGQQDVIFVAITDRETRDRLAEVNHDIGGFPEGMDPFYGAPAVIAVLAEKEWPLRVYDGSLALGNMMLAAHSLGLASCWVHRAKEEFEMDEFKALLKELGAEGEYEGIGHLIVGYADGEYPEAAERKEGKVFYK